MADPFTLDFASLRCLRMVHAQSSFSRAADTLGVSQSSISYTIARLRDVFGDPLFVRQGGGIVATERCADIVAQTSLMVDTLEALAAPLDFDPGTAQLSIGVSCNFYERVTILPELIRVLRREAPGIRLNIIPSQVGGREQLMRGESELLIGAIPIEEARYYRRTLFTDDYVCIMDPENDLATNGIDLASFQSVPQVVVNYGGAFRSRFLVELERQGGQTNTVIEVPSPANIPDILTGTDMIATVPRQIAAVFGDQVASVECPVRAEISIDLHWTPRTHASAAHIWLRGQIAAASARVLANKRHLITKVGAARN
jgi:DNA-binding transcriptional LysR family regulator